MARAHGEAGASRPASTKMLKPRLHQDVEAPPTFHDTPAAQAMLPHAASCRAAETATTLLNQRLAAAAPFIASLELEARQRAASHVSRGVVAGGPRRGHAVGVSPVSAGGTNVAERQLAALRSAQQPATLSPAPCPTLHSHQPCRPPAPTAFPLQLQGTCADACLHPTHSRSSSSHTDKSRYPWTYLGV